MLKLDSMFLCIEGGKVADVSSFPLDTVFLSLHSCYYIFSIQYPNRYKDLFLFIDSVLLGLHHSATTRITLNKFIKALESHLVVKV